ncbi:MAG: pyruvate kinase [Bacteroidales bacterium]|nr:pyruvate kinase [Lentimicrobiaceae bacterium]MDG1136524.1 pyruvate kinase [Bacteroidales bacterium]MDG2081483.1 pyruvate kinase [Bacteroidales bacterium]|tara:strand:+ start:4323 stop:5864 length:1542 start_codon:yes stop_codon:yes gene_type:complete
MDKTEFLMTKIIATLGPATESFEKITELIDAGVRVFRINFSHGAFADYDKLIDNIRSAEKHSGNFVGILGDLSGPKIRTGEVISKGVMLENGQQVKFIKKNVVGGSSGCENLFSTTYPPFIDEVKKGEKILLDDGNIELKCIKKGGEGDESFLLCEVVEGNLLTTAKGINLPDSELSLPSITEKDFECIDYAIKKSLDYIALSFVRAGEDVRLLKKTMRDRNARPAGLDITGGDLGFSTSFEDHYIPIISKIEKPQAIDNLEEILEESDGIMVARGDLGVEMDLAEVAILQKKIIHMCKLHMKPVIVATQMLQSMIDNPVPTRAEVSDVANAIMDGSDAVMLSGETAVGKYPVHAVKMMVRVANKTHNYQVDQFGSRGRFIPYEGLLRRKAAMARGVALMAKDMKAKFIITWSHSGGSSVFLSQQKLHIPIIACGENKKRLQQMSILYSILPMHMNQPKSGSKFIAAVDKMILKNEWAEKGDPIIIVASSPITKRGITNRVILHYLGEKIEEE